MKRVDVLISAVAVSVFVAGVMLATYTQRLESGGEEAAVKAVITAITEAFNRRDAKAWTRLATPDAHLVTVRGESMNGVAEIEKGLTALFQGRNRNASLEILDVQVRLIRPDVALAHVTNELSGVVSADGQTLPPHREHSLRVFVKDQGVWRIRAFHNTLLQP